VSAAARYVGYAPVALYGPFNPSLIAVVCIAAVTLLGNNASNKFSTVAASLN
jgi:hypothetical protein